MPRVLACPHHARAVPHTTSHSISLLPIPVIGSLARFAAPALSPIALSPPPPSRLPRHVDEVAVIAGVHHAQDVLVRRELVVAVRVHTRGPGHASMVATQAGACSGREDAACAAGTASGSGTHSHIWLYYNLKSCSWHGCDRSTRESTRVRSTRVPWYYQYRHGLPKRARDLPVARGMSISIPG